MSDLMALNFSSWATLDKGTRLNKYSSRHVVSFLYY